MNRVLSSKCLFLILFRLLKQACVYKPVSHGDKSWAGFWG
ncbi:hypothetical protein O59_000503 [Cellvibrio sp. BR]|nr:hypothetical protein O59_000503 [Cellvibrio sp. BR]